MKIIDQSHEIISLPDNLLGMIETAGRTCYKSEDKIGCTTNGRLATAQEWEVCSEYMTVKCTPKCPLHSSQQFTTRMRDRGHHAMLEFGDITVRFVTNRGVTHELVRHRLFSYAQESTRYVRYDGQMEFIRPSWITKDEILGEWKNSNQIDINGFKILGLDEMEWLYSMRSSELNYQRLIKNFNWRPEQAREVLPNSLKTEIVVKGNIREWRHCLTLRTSKKAHPQIRALMLPLLDELREKIPVVFDDIE